MNDDGYSFFLGILLIVFGGCFILEIINNGGGPVILLSIIVAIIWYIVEKVKRFIRHLRHEDEDEYDY